MIAAKEQLLSWAHEPFSEELDIAVAQEITLGQMEAEFIGPYFRGKVDSSCPFRWEEAPPTRMADGFMCEIKTSMIPSVREYLN
jgi:hypothetical protein